MSREAFSMVRTEQRRLRSAKRNYEAFLVEAQAAFEAAINNYSRPLSWWERNVCGMGKKTPRQLFYSDYYAAEGWWGKYCWAGHIGLLAEEYVDVLSGGTDRWRDDVFNASELISADGVVYLVSPSAAWVARWEDKGYTTEHIVSGNGPIKIALY